MQSQVRTSTTWKLSLKAKTFQTGFKGKETRDRKEGSGGDGSEGGGTHRRGKESSSCSII